MFQRVDELKQQYTDKYVVVDDTQPELARFKGFTGQVKTVNMSGRALVQFDAWANIGWYDIDPAYLTVISEPLPKPEAKSEAPAKKAPPAAKEKAPPAAKAATPAAAKPAAAKPAGKASTAEILAALRVGKGAAAAAEASSPAAKPPAAKPPAPGAPAAKGKLSTADDLSRRAGEERRLGTGPCLACRRARRQRAGSRRGRAGSDRRSDRRSDFGRTKAAQVGGWVCPHDECREDRLVPRARREVTLGACTIPSLPLPQLPLAQQWGVHQRPRCPQARGTAHPLSFFRRLARFRELPSLRGSVTNSLTV